MIVGYVPLGNIAMKGQIFQLNACLDSIALLVRQTLSEIHVLPEHIVVVLD